VRRILSALLLLLLFWGEALAQSPVVTLPSPATTANGNVSSTIAVTNTFQLVFAATQTVPGGSGTLVSKRNGCTIINNGTHNMYVSEGLSIANASLTNTVILGAGGSYFCTQNGVVLTGQINITGTSGDAFYAAQY
jgi:hypothetical protein